MKKTVYECGIGDYESECEITHTGNMVIVREVRDSTVLSSGNKGLIGIGLVSMIEITGDMAEQFIKNGGARPDTVDALEELVRASREYLRVMTRGKVVV